MHTVSSGCSFFLRAVVILGWRGSESTCQDFSPSARCSRSRVANGWYKKPRSGADPHLSVSSPGSKPPWGLSAGGLSPWHLSCGRNQGSPLRFCQELYSITSVPEASLIFILLFELTILWKTLQS